MRYFLIIMGFVLFYAGGFSMVYIRRQLQKRGDAIRAWYTPFDVVRYLRRYWSFARRGRCPVWPVYLYIGGTLGGILLILTAAAKL